MISPSFRWYGAACKLSSFFFLFLLEICCVWRKSKQKIPTSEIYSNTLAQELQHKPTYTSPTHTTVGFCHSRSYPAGYWQPLKSFREVLGYFNFLYREIIVSSHSLPQCPGCALLGDIPHQIRGVIVVPLPWYSHLDSKQQFMRAVIRNGKQIIPVSHAFRKQNSQFSLPSAFPFSLWNAENKSQSLLPVWELQCWQTAFKSKAAQLSLISNAVL